MANSTCTMYWIVMQELFEITCLVAELLPPLPGDGVFAVDALLCSPGTLVADPVVWQVGNTVNMLEHSLCRAVGG